MASSIQRVSRGRRLSDAEAEKYRGLRASIEAEKPAILARRRAHETATETLLGELKAAREAAGLSLADIRERTGMDRSSIAKLENGQRVNPTLDTLFRYAEALGKRLILKVADSK